MGKVLQVIEQESIDVPECLAFWNNRLYCVDELNHRLYAIPFSNGTFGTPYYCATVHSDTVVLDTDGVYIYLIERNVTSFLCAYSDSGSALSQVGTPLSIGNSIPYAICAATDGYIYIAQYGTGATGITAYSFSGSAFSAVGNDYSFIAENRAIRYLNGIIYTGMYTTTNPLRKYTFNGSDFTLSGSAGGPSDQIWDIAISSTHLFALSNTTLYVYALNDLTTLVDSISLTYSSGRRIQYDGEFIYVYSYALGISVYSFDGSDLSAESAVSDGDYASHGGVYTLAIGNGYVFAANDGDDAIDSLYMKVVAQFNVDNQTPSVGQTVTFTAL